MNYSQVEALGALLSGSNLDDDEEHVTPNHFGRSAGGSSAPVEKNNPNAGQDPLFKTVIKSGPSGPAASAAAPAKPPAVDSRAIWTAEEIERARELVEDDTADGRVKPDYDILYKQSLSAEDVFMNIGMKDGSTEHCEAIVVKVPMPGATMAQVTLDVTPTRLMVRSNRYKLFLHLPHKVNDQQGRAKWDAKTETLAITLPIVREDD